MKWVLDFEREDHQPVDSIDRDHYHLRDGVFGVFENLSTCCSRKWSIMVVKRLN